MDGWVQIGYNLFFNIRQFQTDTSKKHHSLKKFLDYIFRSTGRAPFFFFKSQIITIHGVLFSLFRSVLMNKRSLPGEKSHLGYYSILDRLRHFLLTLFSPTFLSIFVFVLFLNLFHVHKVHFCRCIYQSHRYHTRKSKLFSTTIRFKRMRFYPNICCIISYLRYQLNLKLIWQIEPYNCIISRRIRKTKGYKFNFYNICHKVQFDVFLSKFP